jgi:hypothetical protein
MIEFRCTCQHLFQVSDDESGLDIQCPKCGRLNSVPNTADLALLDNDGMYKVDGEIAPEQVNPAREEELKRIFVNSRVDEFGREIDLRSHSTPLDYQRVGVDPLDIVPEGRGPAAPKYDPETGELIRPMEVRKEPLKDVRAAIPLPRKPKRRVAFERLTHVSPMQLLLDLLKPTNLVVMLLIVVAHVFLLVTWFIVLFGFIFIFPVSILAGIIIIAHFGNVVDETGPSSQDELPRPLRNVSWHDDIWGPCWYLVTSLLICFGPAYFISGSSISNDGVRIGLSLACMVIGALLFPAVLLIRTTSGHFANLRPDRIIGTIRACAGTYPILVVLFIASFTAYTYGIFGVLGTIHQLFSKFNLQMPIWAKWYGSIPLFFFGVYLMHHFAWTLGHVYRVYHGSFPWAYQGATHLDERMPQKRGFSVLPPTRKPSSEPLAALPVANSPTREERLEFVRKSDEARKRDSDQMIKNLPEGHSPANDYYPS